MGTTTSTFNPQTDSCCGRIVQAIDLLNDPTSKMPATGLLTALLSDQNRVGVEIVTPPTTDGYTATSFRKIVTKAIKPDCSTGSTMHPICSIPTNGNIDTHLYITSEHTIDEGISRTITIDVTDFDKFCENPDMYLANKMQQLKAGVFKEINAKLISKVFGYMGSYPGQVSPNTSVTLPMSISLFAPNAFQGGSVLDNNGYAKIVNLYNFLDYIGTEPIIVGGLHLGHLAGLNIQNALSNLFFDSTLDATIADGDSHLLTWAPGTFYLANPIETTQALRNTSVVGIREYSTVFSPFGEGLEWDTQVIHSQSGCQYTIRLQAHFDVLCPVPYDMTCTKKPALHFLTDCTPIDCAVISNVGDNV